MFDPTLNWKLIRVWIISFLISLGIMHHSRLRKIFHVILTLSLYWLIVLFGYKVYAIPIIILYSFTMIIWTLYERRTLFQTFINLHYMNKNDKLTLKPWTSKWEEEVKNEKIRLNQILLSKWKHIFDKELSSDGILHIGSTSIKNIAFAKPVHDIAIAIITKYLPKEFGEDLRNAGYIYVGTAPHTFSCQDHWFFNITPKNEIDSKGYGFDLHVLLPPAHQWLRENLDFCQYLTEHSIDREKYSNLKNEISQTETDIQMYALKKKKLVLMLFEKSRQWAKAK
ncbi:unnamed protein product [Adineta ricciae]|uniref:Uncharacterized protein n=1 Tax=Adineta ricciae TaxID=249248 RepID=A0A815QXR1_ADIRI|nr:unnamed protein product [Adineta ricciae]CAF1469758.1 unnamed protein product [Adineta ricciae]